MPVVQFPSMETLRIALGSGFIPPAIAEEPVRIATGPSGELSIDFGRTEPPLRAGLSRFGVRRIPKFDGDGQTFPCWSVAIPRVRNAEADPFSCDLFAIPHRHVVRFVSHLKRISNRPLVFGWTAECCWIRTPYRIVPQRSDESIASFIPLDDRLWIQSGWRHPVDTLQNPIPGHNLILGPGQQFWMLPDTLFHREFSVCSVAIPELAPPRQLSAVTVPVRLVSDRSISPEHSWLIAAGQHRAFLALLQNLDQRELRPLDLAALTDPDGQPILIVRSRSPRTNIPFPARETFICDEPRHRFYRLSGTRTVPQFRSEDRPASLQPADGFGLWLSRRGTDGIAIHTAPLQAFQRLERLVTYSTKAKLRTAPVPWRDQGFIFDPLIVRSAPPAAIESPPQSVPPNEPAASRGLFSRLIEAVTFRRKELSAPLTNEAEVTPETAPKRINDWIESPERMTVGPDDQPRKEVLETKVLTQLPRLADGPRAELWAELAHCYSSCGRHADAGLCWLNAIAESPRPPAPWFDHWVRAERRAVRYYQARPDWNRILSAPAPNPYARMILAQCVHDDALPSADSLLAAQPAAIRRVLEARDHDLPVRGLWLAHLALARAQGGDRLHVARLRDSLLERLRTRGPALDVDAPAFLRFRGSPSPDRSRGAVEWLRTHRDTIRSWIGRVTGRGELQMFGLDGERPQTTAYADLMLAWGMARLGERSIAQQWSQEARQILRMKSSDHATGVAQTLLNGFELRRLEAADGHPGRPDWPTDEVLNEFDQYAVNRFRGISLILDPDQTREAFDGRHDAAVLGDDPIGQRLQSFLRLRGSPRTHTAASELLDQWNRTNETNTGARLAAVLFDSLPWLDEELSFAVLARIPLAFRQITAWSWTGREQFPTAGGQLAILLCRMTTGVLAAIRRYGFPDACSLLIDTLTGPAAPPPTIRAEWLSRIGPALFRIARNTIAPAQWDQLLDGLTIPSPASLSRIDLIVAAGWMARGQTDRGLAVLDAARIDLFLSTSPDLRRKTDLAIAYAMALGYAPQRIALGRLEELFQRLAPISVHGSTNRYFTIQPLALIDAAVRSVVADDQTTDPAVRRWIDADEGAMLRRIGRDLLAVLANPAGDASR